MKKYLVKNPQAPGGFQSTLGMIFYPDFFFVIDFCKAVKLDYNCTFLKNATNGLCLGMGLLWISQNGEKIIYFLHKEGFVLLKNNKKVAINKKLKLKTAWEDSSMMEFFRFYKSLYDETSNTFFAIHMGRYIIYKLDSDSLKIIQSKKVKPELFKMADDRKQGVHHMMGVEEYYKLLKGVCEVQTVGIDDKYLYVRWGERIGHQSYLDVFDKNSLKLLIEYKLEKTFREGNRVGAFGNGVLYEDDIIEGDEEDLRIIRVYNVRKALQNDLR